MIMIGNVLRTMSEEDSGFSYNQSDLCVLFREALGWFGGLLRLLVNP